MTAWELLAAHSIGITAWDRINSITGGGNYSYLADKQLLFDVMPEMLTFTTAAEPITMGSIINTITFTASIPEYNLG